MGRTRGFDEAAAIHAARREFWHRGYAETSVPDLERATGLSRSSLYHAFGSKRGLFDAAVQSYLEEIVRPPLAPLTAQIVTPDALRTYLLRMATYAEGRSGGDPEDGCLMINTAAGSLAHDETAAEAVRAYHRELLAAVAAGVDASRPVLPDDARSALAAELTGSVVAAMSLARIDGAAAAHLLRLAAARATPRP